MVLLRYLLMMIGIGLLVGAAGILVWDLYQILKSRKSPAAESPTPWEESRSPRWHAARRLVAFSVAPLLIGSSIAVVPSGEAGVRVNQFAGTRPGTLYPGVHWIVPFIETLETYNIRDSIFITTLDEDLKKPQPSSLLVQTREGLTVGLAVAVRYRLDPSRLAYIHANLPQPIEGEMIAPAISAVFRDLAPTYVVREMFATKRDELRQLATTRITAKLAADGIVVKDVILSGFLSKIANFRRNPELRSAAGPAAAIPIFNSF